MPSTITLWLIAAWAVAGCWLMASATASRASTVPSPHGVARRGEGREADDVQGRRRLRNGGHRPN